MGKTIAITGASGFIGSEISQYFESKEYSVIKITRQNLLQPNELCAIVNRADVIINLAGAPIIKRWTKKHKKEILDSRINATTSLVNAIALAKQKPELFISFSAIGIYNSINTHTESSTDYANDYLANVVKDWEKAAQNDVFCRKVLFRVGVVLGKNGGIYKKMKPVFKAGIGASIGNGKQSFSFVHIRDLIAAIEFVINNKKLNGVFNLCSPYPITNKIFTQILAKNLNRLAFLRIPDFIIKLFFGEGSIVLTLGQKVVPDKLLKQGFKFQYPDIDSALKAISKN